MGKVFDRVHQTTTSEGEGVMEMTGTVSGYNSWIVGATLATGSSSGPWLDVNYQIEQRDSNGDIVDWEIGTGTLYKNDGGNPYITRDVVKSSSTGSKIDFGSGTKNIWNAPQSSDFNGTLRRNPGALSFFAAWIGAVSPEISGYYYSELDYSAGFEFEADHSIVVLQSNVSEQLTSIQWRITSDNNIRRYSADAAAPSGNHYMYIVSGFPRVHHLLVDFGAGSVGSNTLEVSSGVTLNNYQNSLVINNFQGYPNVNGDARVDLVNSIYLVSNTEIGFQGILNDSGDVRLCVSIIEF